MGGSASHTGKNREAQKKKAQPSQPRFQRPAIQPLAHRFEVEEESDWCRCISYDCWNLIFSEFLLDKIVPVTRVNKSFYNTFWETRRKFIFDFESSTEKITDEVLFFLLTKCSKVYINEVTLSYCNQIGSSREILETIFELPGIRKINLAYCFKVQSSYLENIGKLLNLQSLNLTGCELLGKIALQYIAQLTQLKKLVLKEMPNIMTLSPIAQTLSNLQTLKVISLPSLITITSDTAEEHIMDPNFFGKDEVNIGVHFGVMTNLTKLTLVPNASVFRKTTGLNESITKLSNLRQLVIGHMNQNPKTIKMDAMKYYNYNSLTYVHYFYSDMDKKPNFEAPALSFSYYYPNN